MRAVLAALLSLALLAGCASPARPPLALAPAVDLARFMGDWYVIASIPTFIETGAHNAIESYRLDADGSIATTFTFREGGFDGEPKRYTPRGFVVPGTGNAVWGMRFGWPRIFHIEADFRIAWLAPDYGQVVIGREKRDYVWIMARQPQIPEADYQRLLGFLREQGYDPAKLRRVPQRWP